MCGRYAATANPDELVEEFEISFVADEMAGHLHRVSADPGVGNVCPGGIYPDEHGGLSGR